jgi:hypothetical protein
VLVKAARGAAFTPFPGHSYGLSREHGQGIIAVIDGSGAIDGQRNTARLDRCARPAK